MAHPIRIDHPARAARPVNPRVERIIEFSTGETQDALQGGLLSLRLDANGRLVVELYRLDPGITVHVTGTSSAGHDYGYTVVDGQLA